MVFYTCGKNLQQFIEPLYDFNFKKKNQKTIKKKIFLKNEGGGPPLRHLLGSGLANPKRLGGGPSHPRKLPQG